MFRSTRRCSRQSCSISRHAGQGRRLRVEPLEDRRMLSVTLFVDADAPTGGNGLVWSSAYADLQAALDDAATRNADTIAENDVDQVWIAEGVYRPTAELRAGDPRSASFSLLDGVTLYGGFAGSETAITERNWTSHETVFSGNIGEKEDASDNAYTVVYCGKDIDTAIDGVSIDDGRADGYSGSHPEQGGGGGIYNAGTLTVTNSMLSGNSADDGGGGIYNSGALTVANSTLSGNSADDGGGGIYNSGALTVANSALSANSAVYGGGGGIHSSGTLTVTNSTLSVNSAMRYDAGGGGICSSGSSSATTLNNTIVAGNLASSGPDIYHDSGTLSGSHNLVGDGSSQSSFVDGEGGNLIGTSMSPIDPRLSDWTELDNGRWGYYLLPGSPAVDAGKNTLAVDVARRPLIEDLSGSARIQNTTVDIGAVEGAAVGNPAQVYVVTSLDRTIAEDGVLTFLEAFEAADRNQPVGDAPAGSFAESDVIRFAEGLSGTVPVEDGELTIHGDLGIEGPGPALLAFDGGGTSRVFLIELGASASLSGMMITRGSADDGGGIYCAGMLTVANSTLSENSADKYGGGIYNSGTLTVTNSTLAGNWAYENGGGISNNSGTLTVANSTLSENSVDHWAGGGIYSNHGTLTVTNSTLSGNSATYGGGIHNYFGTLTVTGSTLSGNSAIVYGGGIDSSGTLTVTNSTLSGNSVANYSGGGICCTGESSTAMLNNTLVAGNAARSGRDISHGLGPYSGTLSGSCNLIGDGSGQSSLVHGEGGNLVGTSTSPIDPRLSDWSELDNGRWGYCLLPESPALDAAENALAVDAMGQPIIEDLYGNPRIQNGTVDIGSVEGVTAGSPAQTYVVSSLDRTVAEDGVLTFLEAFDAANRNQPVGDAPAGSFAEADVIQFADGLSGTIRVENGELVIQGDLSIEGPGTERLTFDAEDTSRVFLVKPGVSASLSGMTITGGSADTHGGGIYSFGTLAVTNSLLSGNAADNRGGGIYNNSGTLTVTGSTLSGNSADWGGGGICSYWGMLTLTNSAISGNAATGPYTHGGGIYNYFSTLTVTNSTLSGNGADDRGGGIYSRGDSSTVMLNNTLVAGNAASSGRDIHRNSGTLSGSCNLIGDGSGQSSLIDGVDGNLVGTSEAPIDPRFIRNPSDGGDGWGDDPSTPDVDESANDDFGNVRLRPDSPAVDTGDDSLLPADEFDLDGDGDTAEPIPFDLVGNPRVAGARVDMGGYEYDPTPPIPGDLDGNGRVNSADLDIVRAHWGESVTPGSLFDGDPSGDGVVNSDDLDIIRANWGQTAVAAAVPTAESGAEPSVEDSVYGPVLPNEAATAEERNRDTFFAARRELAEAAWMDAVERSKTRREVREARAVDVVLLEWDGR